MRIRMFKSSNIALMLLLVLIVVSSCKPSVPSRYIQPDDMEDILYDYHLAQSIAANNRVSSDTTAFYKNVYYQSVLKEHGVSEAEFDSSLVYYYTEAERLHDIYRNISERMNNLAMAYGASSGELGKYSQYDQGGDTANIWQDVYSTCLTPFPTNNRFDFYLEADTTYRRGDSFLFNCMIHFLYQSGTKDATLYIAVTYENDSVNSYYRKFSVSGLSQLRIPANNQSDIKNIKGFIYLNKGQDDSKTLKLMFVNQIQFIRFHSKDKLENQHDGNSQGSVNKGINLAKPSTLVNPMKVDLKLKNQNDGKP